MNKSSLESVEIVIPHAPELLKRLEKYQKFFELTPDVICSIDAQGRFVTVSAAAEKLWGYRPEELVGVRCFDMIVEEDRGFTISITRDIFDGSCINHYENRFLHKDGHIVWVSWSVFRDEDDQLIHGIARDISWRNHAYEELLDQKERLKRACHVAKLGIWGMDLVNNQRYSSDELFFLCGIEKGNRTYITDEEFLSLVHPDDVSHLLQNLKQLQNLSTHTIEHRLIRKDKGAVIYLQHNLQVIRDNDSKVICVHGTTTDITEKKKQEQELKISNERFEFVSKATSDAIWDYNIVKKTTFYNEAFTHLFGHPHEEQQSADIWEINLHPDDKERMINEVNNAINDPVVSILNSGYRFKRLDGSYAYVNDRALIIRDERGQGVRIVGSMQDVTKQKEAEEAVRMSEERYELLFFKSPSPKWIYNALTLRIIEVNDAACQLYGYSREEFLELTVPELKVEQERHLLNAEIQNTLFRNDQPFYNIVRHQKKNGEIFQVEINAHGIKLLTGCHVIVTGYDMTERLAFQNKIVEEQVVAQREVTKAVIQTQEKERGIISKELHDNVNQILTAAKLCIENTRYYPEQRDVFTTRGITMIQNAIQEIRSLSKALVSPAVYESSLKVNMLEMLDQYRNLQRFEIEEELNFEEDGIDNELKLTIYRIVQELMNNTVKYAEATRVDVCIEQQDRTLTVVMHDNGKGFDVNSKKDGLGLANIKSRVELFNGTLDIESSIGNGCKTLIVFPL